MYIRLSKRFYDLGYAVKVIIEFISIEKLLKEFPDDL